MDDVKPTASDQRTEEESSPDWTYPTRFCRICREDVPPTVTMYPPGIPMQFQKQIVEYKNDDEYGRLIKPCNCRGTQRYIHELCLLRARTENPRAGSMWKCHECGYQFDFKKLTIQRMLSSRIVVAILTMLFMIFMVFILGFVADPIINIYLDPYDSLTGRESIWEELEVRSAQELQVSAWSQHFAKGFISMGLVGFLKTLLLNPFHWLQLNWGGVFGTAGRRGTTGRDRAVNLSWIAIVIGVCSAFAVFYRFVSSIIQRGLQRIGNNIVDTQLPGDDDDLKPPPGWKATPARESTTTEQVNSEAVPGAESETISADLTSAQSMLPQEDIAETADERSKPENVSPASSQTHLDNETSLMGGSWIDVGTPDTQRDDQVPQIHRQGWSFANL